MTVVDRNNRLSRINGLYMKREHHEIIGVGATTYLDYEDMA